MTAAVAKGGLLSPLPDLLNPIRYDEDRSALAGGVDYSALATLPEMWPIAAARFGDLPALRDPHGKTIDGDLSFRQFAQQVQQVAAGLQSIVSVPRVLSDRDGGLLIPPRLALIADNSPRWLLADQGSMAAGFANAVRSATAETQELAYILRDSGAEVLMVQDGKTLRRLADGLVDLPLKAIVLLSDEDPAKVLGDWPALALLPQLNWPDLLARGAAAELQPVQRDRTTLATLIYTSGTTGQPKGVMLSHQNLLHQMVSLRAIASPQPGDRVLTLLPTWHSFGRVGDYYLLCQGCTLIYTSIRHVKTDFKLHKPHYMTAVPRLWESIYEGVQKQLASQPARKQALVQRCLAWSERYILARRQIEGLRLVDYEAPAEGRPGSENAGLVDRLQARLTTWLYGPLHHLADKVVYGTIRQATGGEFRYAISGGGSLAHHLELFFEIVGIQVLVGYGLTETAPVLSARRPWRNLRGSSGLPLPATEFRSIDPESRRVLPVGQRGLILARGPQIMAGYFGKPEATAKAIDPEGWFDTGDLGWLSAKGDVTITGRAKDTIVLTNGENIEPQPIEDACLRSPYIQQIMLVGQDQKTLGALIVPDWEALASWAADQGQHLAQPGSEATATDLTLSSPVIETLYRNELAREVKNRPGYKAEERISLVLLLAEPFSIENGCLTQTLKVRRNVVTDRYSEVIAGLFRGDQG